MHRGHMMHTKSKNGLKSLVELKSYLRPHLIPFIFSLIFSVGGTIFTIVNPRILGNMINQIQIEYQTGINIDTIVKTGILLITYFIISALFTYLSAFLMTGITQKISFKLRKQISVKINKLPLSYFDTRSYGDVLSRVTNDVDTVSQNLNQSITQVIAAISSVIGILIMMLTISWQLTLVAIVSIPVSMILMGTAVKFSQKHFKAQQGKLGQINGHIEEIYGAHLVVKAFNGEEDAISKFDEINQDLYKSSWKSQFISGLMMPLMGFVGNLSYVAVCIVGGTHAIKQKLFIGDITAFIQYIRQFNQPLSQVAQIANVLQSAAAANERIMEFLSEKEMDDESDKTIILEDVKGDVEFKQVHFGYHPDKMIIHDFNSTIKQGQKVAIVGPTGAGKTTLINLIMRFYETNQGDIYIDGVNIKDITRKNVHQLFGMVLQDTWLFEGTIRENLKYAKPNATDEEMVDACKATHIDHFIKSLPGGYDMILNETASISGGQKQLITIARAMIENAPMLILDEATSNVDTRTEVLIQSAMNRLTKGRTSFVIAHRLSTIKDADLILVMRDGNIVEQGTHTDLLNQNGFYADLYHSQFAHS
jgi:ATP-binding cassette, subfamily B, multidrug efflux pump